MVYYLVNHAILGLHLQQNYGTTTSPRENDKSGYQHRIHGGTVVAVTRLPPDDILHLRPNHPAEKRRPQIPTYHHDDMQSFTTAASSKSALASVLNCILLQCAVLLFLSVWGLPNDAMPFIPLPLHDMFTAREK